MALIARPGQERELSLRRDGEQLKVDLAERPRLRVLRVAYEELGPATLAGRAEHHGPAVRGEARVRDELRRKGQPLEPRRRSRLSGVPEGEERQAERSTGADRGRGPRRSLPPGDAGRRRPFRRLGLAPALGRDNLLDHDAGISDVVQALPRIAFQAATQQPPDRRRCRGGQSVEIRRRVSTCASVSGTVGASKSRLPVSIS